MPKYRVFFVKEMWNSTEVEAIDKDDAREQAQPYYNALNTDYYYGDDWSIDYIEEIPND